MMGLPAMAVKHKKQMVLGGVGMYCKNCGQELADGVQFCPACGAEVKQVSAANGQEAISAAAANANLQPEQTETTAAATKPAAKELSNWCYGAIVSAILAFVTLCMGFNKLWRYDSGDEYGFDAVNAYVGGDAYNYIINGTHAIAYFVLTTMFVLLAIGLLILHYLSQKEEYKGGE